MAVSVLDGRWSLSIDEATAIASESEAQVTVRARLNGTTYYDCSLTYSGYNMIYTGCNVRRCLAGVITVIGSASPSGSITFEVVGSSITVKQGATTLISLTDTNIANAGDWTSVVTFASAVFTSLDSAGGVIHQGASALTASLNAANAARAVYRSLALLTLACNSSANGSLVTFSQMAASGSLSAQSGALLLKLSAALLEASGSVLVNGNTVAYGGAQSLLELSASAAGTRVALGASDNVSALTVNAAGLKCLVGALPSLLASLSGSAGAALNIIGHASLGGSAQSAMTAVTGLVGESVITAGSVLNARGKIAVQLAWQTEGGSVVAWETEDSGSPVEWTRIESSEVAWLIDN